MIFLIKLRLIKYNYYNMINKEDLKKIIPGFSMGIVRAIISHPFEMMKIKSQINYKTNFYSNLFKGLHYSVLTNALERGIQFGLYEKFKLNDNNIISSSKASIISTSISFPYNVILLRNVVMKSTINITISVMPQRMRFEDLFSLMEQKSVL